MTRMIDKVHPAVIVVLGIGALVALDLQSGSERKVEPLHYRGELRAADGQPIMGSHVIGVELWDSAERGERLCAVQAQPIAVERGAFNLLLSDACTGALQHGRGAWADLEVDGERLLPRAQLVKPHGVAPDSVQSGDTVAPVGSDDAHAPANSRSDGVQESPREADSASEPRESNFRI
jgi:hypothetical protein